LLPSDASVVVVVVTLWADNWWWHRSAGRRSMCCGVTHHLRVGQLSTHHWCIADPSFWLPEPASHWALWLSTNHPCRHPQT